MKTSRIQQLKESFQQQLDQLLARFSPCHFYLGVSGGVDSMSLLVLFSSYIQMYPGLCSLTVLHFNHGLRGKDSDQDQRFVQEICRQKGLPFQTARPAEKLGEKGNLEEEARSARYRFFEQAMRNDLAISSSEKRESSAASTSQQTTDLRQKEESVLPVLALAHQAEDQTESIFMHLIQGAALDGLAGMSGLEMRMGSGFSYFIFRPLLDFSKEDLQAYCRQEGFSWREDQSNQDDSYQRNFLRRQILPAIRQKMNPSLDQTLARNARQLQEEVGFLDRITQEAAEEVQAKPESGLDFRGKLLAGESKAVSPGLLQSPLFLSSLSVELLSNSPEEGSTFPRTKEAFSSVQEDRDQLFLPPYLWAQKLCSMQNYLALESAQWKKLDFALQKRLMKSFLFPLSGGKRISRENIERACRFVCGEEGRELRFCGIIFLYIQKGAILISEAQFVKMRKKVEEQAPFYMKVTTAGQEGHFDWPYPALSFDFQEIRQKPSLEQLTDPDFCFLRIETGDQLEISPGESREVFKKFSGGSKALRRRYTEWQLPELLRPFYPLLRLNGQILWVPAFGRAAGRELGEMEEETMCRRERQGESDKGEQTILQRILQIRWRWR